MYRYCSFLDEALKLGKKNGLVAGMAMGTIFGILFSTYYLWSVFVSVVGMDLAFGMGPL